MAFASTPILAIYGVSPFYIFNKLPSSTFFLTLFILSALTFIFWIINIDLISVIPENNKKRRYFLSFLFTSLCYLIVFIIMNPPFEMQIQNNYIIHPFLSVLSINSIIIIISNLVLVEQKKDRAEIEIQLLKISNLEAQKQVLAQQLQPHFLFNTLSALKSLISENPLEAEKYSVKLSEFLRYSVDSAQRELVAVEEELKFVFDYFAIQKVRFKDAIQIEMEGNTSLKSKKIPVFALQTLVENAIKHNSFTDKKPLKITISYTDQKISVTNNKIYKKSSGRKGTGLDNLTKRYQMITGENIAIINSENKFNVTLQLMD